MTRKHRQWGRGLKPVSLAKHRTSGHPNPSRRQKEWMAREINALAPTRRPARMYSSLRELFSDRGAVR